VSPVDAFMDRLKEKVSTLGFDGILQAQKLPQAQGTIPGGIQKDTMSPGIVCLHCKDMVVRCDPTDTKHRLDPDALERNGPNKAKHETAYNAAIQRYQKRLDAARAKKLKNAPPKENGVQVRRARFDPVAIPAAALPFCSPSLKVRVVDQGGDAVAVDAPVDVMVTPPSVQTGPAAEAVPGEGVMTVEYYDF